MKVTSVLLNFRVALLTLVPIVERVGIPWKRPEAYDEWDSIVSVLFENLVVKILRWSLPENDQRGMQLPAYDLLLPTYADLSTLEVVHPSLQPGRWLFHAFGTESEAFDLVEVRPLAVDGSLLSGELKKCPIDGAVFRFRIHSDQDPIEKIEISED
jgi:hypothetical protein